jgi:hypothetical protein
MYYCAASHLTFNPFPLLTAKKFRQFLCFAPPSHLRSITATSQLLTRYATNNHPTTQTSSTITSRPFSTATMSDSDSDDDLRPHERTGRHYANAFFSDSDNELELGDNKSDDASIGSSLCSGSRDGIPNGIDDSSTSRDDDSADARPSNQGGRNGVIVVDVPADLPPEERADLGNIPPPPTWTFNCRSHHQR